MNSTGITPRNVAQASFATTRWTVVLSAGDPHSAGAATALEALCRAYWYPLYAYVRRRGHSAADAQDLTQEFFARLLEHNWIARADRQKGRFRSFLLMAMNRFLANEWDKARTQKRGGDLRLVPLPPNAPQGLCPECLLKAGLGSGIDIGLETQTASDRERFVAPSPDEIARLFPQLEILGFIGQGGMGAVYRARQKALDRIVALKILPPDVGSDPAFTERFTREARALAKMNHPGVVTLYEFGQANQLYFFLMKYVDDETSVVRARRLDCGCGLSTNLFHRGGHHFPASQILRQHGANSGRKGGPQRDQNGATV